MLARIKARLAVLGTFATELVWLLVFLGFVTLCLGTGFVSLIAIVWIGWTLDLLSGRS